MENNQELLELIRELVRYQKILAKPVIRILLDETLDKPEKKLVYELTDGENSRDKIIEETGLGAGTVSSWWIDWFSKGLLEKNGNKYRKITSLKDVGISLIPFVNKKGESTVQKNFVEGVSTAGGGKADGE